MADVKKVRWGIISTANIGTEKVIPGIQKSEHSEVVAIASRELSKAQEAAAQLPEAEAKLAQLEKTFTTDHYAAEARAALHAVELVSASVLSVVPSTRRLAADC